MTRDEAQQFFDRRLDAWKRRDVDALTLDHSEDCVLESPMAGEVRGRSAIESIYRGLMASFPDFTIESTELVIDGSRVVQISTMSGTNTGGFMGLPPTGRQFKFPVVAIHRLDGNLIVHERRIYDFTGLLTQIGVLKAKPASP